MKKRRTKNLIFVSAMLLFLAACKEKTVIYDSTLGEAMLSAESVEEAVPEPEEEKPSEKKVSEEEVSREEPETFLVYVCGEVHEAGVYELFSGARLNDAIEAAGGMTEKAARGYLNLAEYARDGQKIEVPSEEEAQELKALGNTQEAGNAEKADTRVNLNTASAEQLMTLTGIGEAKARDILSYRETHGGFSRIEELMEIPGIKSGVFQKIKEQITI